MPLALRALLLWLLAAVSLALGGVTPTPALADGPLFDFRETDFSKEGRRSLAGTWMFAFDTRFAPAEAHAAYFEGELMRVDAPGNWLDYLPDDETNRYRHGTASFLARVQIPTDIDRNFVLSIPRVSDAYEVFWIPTGDPWGAVQVASDGTMEGELRSSAGRRGHALPIDGDGILLINVRKELSSIGGITNSIFIYDNNTFQNSVQMNRLLEGVFLGITGLLAAINLSIYFAYRKDPASLVLGIASLAVVMHGLILGGSIETILGPEWRSLRIRIQHANIFVLAHCALQIHLTFLRGRKASSFPMGHLGLSIIGVAFCMVAPLPVVTKNMVIISLFAVATLAVILNECLTGALKGHRLSIFSLLCWMAVTAAAISEVSGVFNEGSVLNFLDYTFAAFLLPHSVLVGSRVAVAMNRAMLLAEEHRSLKREHRSVLASSRRDHLTGLLNRQTFDAALNSALETRDLKQSCLSLVLFDIDHFKSVNDTHGHRVGDQVLQSIAGLLQEARLRKTDTLCRYGGEEFALILPDTHSQDAVKIADRIRMMIQNHAITCSDNLTLRVTCSFGVARICEKSKSDIRDVVENADAALYHAKRSGRNTVINFTEMELEEIMPLTA